MGVLWCIKRAGGCIVRGGVCIVGVLRGEVGAL